MSVLVQRILALADALAAAGVPYAFGGALALAYAVEEPRGTRDVDINVFVAVDRAEEVFRSLPPEVAWGAADVETVVRDGQVRVFWDETPVDLFFSTHRFHDAAARAARSVPLAGRTIPVLAPTHLAVFKAFFNRTKDWADIEAMAEVGSIDVTDATGWVHELLGNDDERTLRLDRLLRGAAS